MLLWLLRGLFVLIIIGMAVAAFSTFSDAALENKAWAGTRAALIIMLIGGVVLATDLWERNKQITTLSAVYFGLLLGLLLGWLFTLAVEQFLDSLDFRKDTAVFLVTRVLITVICCYITISTLMQTKDEFRFIIPYVEFSKQVKGNKPLVLDTSVIIDGRIADLCDTRIIDNKLIVTRFVLQELQAIADSSDKLRRNRGRRGLDILKKLQSNTKIELLMHEGNVAEVREAGGERIRVDERLVLFAKSVGGRVVTNDFNLNKIAQLQGVEVINLNEVANSLKTVALPGEFMNIRIVKPGDQPGQGVGYLDDGTMVVVEQGRTHIGNEVPLTVTSVLQTPAGRMIFGRVDSARPAGTAPGTAEAKALDK